MNGYNTFLVMPFMPQQRPTQHPLNLFWRNALVLASPEHVTNDIYLHANESNMVCGHSNLL